MSTEKVVRKRVRRNLQKQIDDLVVYCKVSVDILEELADEVSATKIQVFKAVLKRLGVAE